MRKVSVPVERPVTAAVIGLPAAELAKTLDGILDGDASPENDTPTAFPQGDDPYSLEELLSGLEPVDADDVAPIDDGLEPALLLSETELPDAIATDGWLGEPALAPEELPAEPEDTAPVLELPSDEVLLLTSDMVLEAAARQDEDLGEADPDDHTTAALSAIAAALHALDGPPPPPESAAAEGDSADDDDLDAPLLLTDAYLAPEPALAEIPAEAAAEEAAPEEDVYELTEIVAEPAALEAAPEEDVYELTEIVTEPAAVEAAPEEDVFEPTEIVAEPAVVEAAPEEDVYEATEIVTQPAAVEAAPEEDVYELTEIVAEPAVVEAALDEDVYELTEIVTEPAVVEAALDEDVYELTEIVAEPAAVEAALEEDVYEPTEIVAEPAVVEAEAEEDVYELTEIVAEPAVVEAVPEKDGFEPTEVVAEPAAVGPAPEEGVVEVVDVTAEEPVTASVEAGEEPVPGSRLSLADRVEAIIAAYGGAEGHGDATLPASEDALALLLSEPPPMDDFAALDALYACWPRSTQDCPSRALLAVAHNLTRNFGLPGRLPMASAKAWRMLSPKVFEAELAQRLTDTGTFIADWQKTQNHFLILEFGEIELIEYLFEALPPAAHADLLVGVMNFKVLSNRRMGLLRRVPGRVKKQVLPLLPARKDEALLILAHTKALLERVAEPNGFAPIVATAVKAAEEVDKMMRAVAAIGLPPPSPPEGGGQALGRIG